MLWGIMGVMIFGFIDESGAPGVATNDNDFLVVSVVLFQDEKEMENCNCEMDALRQELHLTSDYEFHCSRNNSRAQNAMFDLMARLNFKFITIAIKKNQTKSYASYRRVAELLVYELASRYQSVKLLMDTNPILLKELRSELRASSLEKRSVKEIKSHADNLVQLTDYVVNVCAKKAKGHASGLAQFRLIAAKSLTFISVS